MSERFTVMLSQMQAWDTLVLIAAMLAVGLIWTARQFEISHLPLIVRFRSQILTGYWGLVVVIYLVIAGTMAVWGFHVG